jgi:hypothetical protein
MKLKREGKMTHTVTLSAEDILEMLSDCGTLYSPGRDAVVTVVMINPRRPLLGATVGASDSEATDDLITVTWTGEMEEVP